MPLLTVTLPVVSQPSRGTLTSRTIDLDPEPLKIYSEALSAVYNVQPGNRKLNQ